MGAQEEEVAAQPGDEEVIPESLEHERYAGVRVESVIEREFATESKAKEGEEVPEAPEGDTEGDETPEGEQSGEDANAQAESDETPSQEESGEEEQPGEEEPHPKTAAGRLKELLRERAKERQVAQRELERLQARVAELEAGPTEEDPAKEKLKLPKPEDFVDEFGDLDEEAHTAALEDYAEKLAAQKLAEKTKGNDDAAEATQQQAVQKMFADYDTREAEYAPTSETYAESKQYVESLLVSTESVDKEKNPMGFVSPQAAAISKALLLADNGPGVVDYLGENPEELEGMLAATDALEIGMRVQRIAAQYSAHAPQDAEGEEVGDAPPAPQVTRRKVSKAPKPRPTVQTGGGGSEPDLDSLAKTDTAAYARARGLDNQGW